MEVVCCAASSDQICCCANEMSLRCSSLGAICGHRAVCPASFCIQPRHQGRQRRRDSALLGGWRREQ